MHGAPSVSYPVGRSRFAGGLMACLWLVGCSAGTVWTQYDPDPWRLVAMWVALFVTGVLAATHWWFTMTGTLTWDGDAWHWSGCEAGALARLDVALDLQHQLLVRWVAPGTSGWVWLARVDGPDRWDDLRRAIHSHSGPRHPAPDLPAAHP